MSHSLPLLQPTLPQPPVFDRVEDERLHRKQRLAAALRLFARYGFDEGVAGHITARDPELSDHFWVNPFGMYFGHIRVAIHSQIHLARPDVVAAAHSHSLYGKAWSTLGRLLDPLTQDACSFYNDHAVFDDYTGVVLTREEGQRIGQALGQKKAVILRNHGLLTVGHSVDEAAWWFITMDRSCQAQLAAEAAGTPVPIDPEVARLTFSQVGSPYMGWFSFQSLYDKIVKLEPDLLE
jgi:ribulose-5-phosphate 4-epimerase/fuculose-1-phosphate aldolase